jgi:hypothetical protein
MTDKRLQAAAENNASWCAAVCRAHGDEGHMYEAVWLHPTPAPKFYPNAVTLLEGHSERLIELLTPTITQSNDSAYSVKDSYAQVDLSSYGARVLFDAQWLWNQHPDSGCRRV